MTGTSYVDIMQQLSALHKDPRRANRGRELSTTRHKSQAFKHCVAEPQGAEDVHGALVVANAVRNSKSPSLRTSCRAWLLGGWVGGGETNHSIILQSGSLKFCSSNSFLPSKRFEVVHRSIPRQALDLCHQCHKSKNGLIHGRSTNLSNRGKGLTCS